MVRSINKDSFAPEFHGESGLDGKFGSFPESSEKPIVENWLFEIYSRIKSFPQKVHYVLTGPFTNIGFLIKIFPDIVQYIEQVVVMGGAIGFGNSTPSAEFNVYSDPEAANILFHSDMNVTMVPLEVTHTALIDDEILKKISELNTKFSKILVEQNFDYPPLHDPCAVLFVIHPEIFQGKLVYVEVDTKSEISYGRTCCDFYLTSKKNPNVFVTEKMNVKVFWENMLDAIFKANKDSYLN